MDLDDRVVFGAIVFAGVAIPGVASYFLSEIGADTLGQIVWAAGYGGMILFVWYHWLRPMDMQGA
ncbi:MULTISPECIES: hypothetical protein [Halobacterium]|jgi:hypothetical protein|uniref:Uncharacterized protein n=1 Tax=Halobacterium sp. NMX12-1 TaxID=3166650 RepID=A0AAU8CH84_9EURY|nr:hypothetical protein [Halobacterium noricense]UHH27005.1 hypothetical protein LT974_17135 [Halobacterium noricense]